MSGFFLKKCYHSDMRYSDSQLIISYLDGDKESFEFLVKRYLRSIYLFIYKYVGNSQDAEDAAQEVFVKVWRHLKKFDQRKNFKTWIFTIAKNTALDFLKKKKTIPFSAFENEAGDNMLIETLADSAPLPQEILEKATMAQTLASAIKKLSPKYNEVVSLRYKDNFNFREIAESLKEPINTIKSRYRRALIILKKLLFKEDLR